MKAISRFLGEIDKKGLNSKQKKYFRQNRTQKFFYAWDGIRLRAPVQEVVFIELYFQNI